MASAPPQPLEQEHLHALEPEARLVAAVFRQALKDAAASASELSLARDSARAFLAGRGSFGFFCALGNVDPASVARGIAAQLCTKR